MSVTISGSGQIIKQVIQTVKLDTFSTTSTSLVDVTGLSVSITPTNSANRILVMYNVSLNCSGGGNDSWFSLLRNSTQVFNSTGGTVNATGKARAATYIDGTVQGGAGMFLDSPATTSATTYKIQVATNATAYINTTSYNPNGVYVTSSITVMEVAYA